MAHTLDAARIRAVVDRHRNAAAESNEAVRLGKSRQPLAAELAQLREALGAGAEAIAAESTACELAQQLLAAESERERAEAMRLVALAQSAGSDAGGAKRRRRSPFARAAFEKCLLDGQCVGIGLGAAWELHRVQALSLGRYLACRGDADVARQLFDAVRVDAGFAAPVVRLLASLGLWSRLGAVFGLIWAARSAGAAQRLAALVEGYDGAREIGRAALEAVFHDQTGEAALYARDPTQFASDLPEICVAEQILLLVAGDDALEAVFGTAARAVSGPSAENGSALVQSGRAAVFVRCLASADWRACVAQCEAMAKTAAGDRQALLLELSMVLVRHCFRDAGQHRAWLQEQHGAAGIFSAATQAYVMHEIQGWIPREPRSAVNDYVAACQNKRALLVAASDANAAHSPAKRTSGRDDGAEVQKMVSEFERNRQKAVPASVTRAYLARSDWFNNTFLPRLAMAADAGTPHEALLALLQREDKAPSRSQIERNASPLARFVRMLDASVLDELPVLGAEASDEDFAMRAHNLVKAVAEAADCEGKSWASGFHEFVAKQPERLLEQLRTVVRALLSEASDPEEQGGLASAGGLLILILGRCGHPVLESEPDLVLTSAAHILWVCVVVGEALTWSAAHGLQGMEASDKHDWQEVARWLMWRCARQTQSTYVQRYAQAKEDVLEGRLAASRLLQWVRFEQTVQGPDVWTAVERIRHLRARFVQSPSGQQPLLGSVLALQDAPPAIVQVALQAAGPGEAEEAVLALLHGYKRSDDGRVASGLTHLWAATRALWTRQAGGVVDWLAGLGDTLGPQTTEALLWELVEVSRAAPHHSSASELLAQTLRREELVYFCLSVAALRRDPPCTGQHAFAKPVLASVRAIRARCAEGDLSGTEFCDEMGMYRALAHVAPTLEDRSKVVKAMVRMSDEGLQAMVREVRAIWPRRQQSVAPETNTKVLVLLASCALRVKPAAIGAVIKENRDLLLQALVVIKKPELLRSTVEKAGLSGAVGVALRRAPEWLALEGERFIREALWGS